MKLCVDCEWYGGVALQNGKPVCEEPRNDFTSRVDGFELKFDALTLRQDERYCGLEGKWWKEKVT
jgi:hypothetical protein